MTCLGEVGLGDDPDERAVLLDDGQPPELVLAHQTGCLLEALLGIDRDEIARGELADGRVRALAAGDDVEREVAVGDDAR